MAIIKRSLALIKWSAALVIFLCMFKVDYISDSTANDPVQWALLIAGGYELKDSYAFEADISRTFALLKAGGLKEENIVVFFYDTVESHKDNPFQGRLRPDFDKDYYAALRKDYTGRDVTSHNILSALSGNRWAVGYRKVISSSRRDTIFLVISAHGTPENIVINGKEFIEKHALMEGILSLQRERKFESLMMYSSSCHGACIIEDIIFPERSRIHIVVSSYCGQRAIGDSCKTFFLPTGKGVTICTSSDFHRTWLNHSNAINRMIVEVNTQYREIRDALAKPVRVMFNDAWVWRFSNTARFGDMSVKNEKLEKFQGSDPQWH